MRYYGVNWSILNGRFEFQDFGFWQATASGSALGLGYPYLGSILIPFESPSW